MAGVSLKQEEDALFSGQKKARPNNKLKPKFEGKTNQQRRSNQRRHTSGGASNHLKSNEDQDDRCYNCGKKGHYARDCWHKKKKGQGNVATSSNQQQAKGQESCGSEEDWDAEAACAVATIEEEKEEKDEVALMAASKSRRINYESDWIIDSGCSNHMIGDIEKLEGLEKYKGR